MNLEAMLPSSLGTAHSRKYGTGVSLKLDLAHALSGLWHKCIKFIVVILYASCMA